MHTKYNDFREFIKDKYPNCVEDIENYISVPELVLHPKHETIMNLDEVVSFILSVISKAEMIMCEDDEWSNLEESIGRIEYDELFEDLFDMYDKDGDYDFVANIRNQEDFAYNIESILYISSLLVEQVKTIEISTDFKVEFYNLVQNNNCKFISFNYTSTLQKLYNVVDVCHIHGNVDEGDELFFGHGCIESYEGKYLGAKDTLDTIDNLLRKDCNKAFEQKASFFNSLVWDYDISEIYSYGFSFSDVDMFYIEKVMNLINTNNTTFYLNNFDKQNFCLFKNKIIQAGFKGTFDVYTI